MVHNKNRLRIFSRIYIFNKITKQRFVSSVKYRNEFFDWDILYTFGYHAHRVHFCIVEFPIIA